jgi:hypothetical protein
MGFRDGLVGAWCPSLGATAGTLLDRSGRNNHGTLTNLTAANGWQSLSGGFTIRTTGTDQASISLNQSHVLLARDYSRVAMAFSCWLRPNALNKRGICSSGPALTAPSFAATLLTTGRIEIYRGSNVTSSGSISAGVWSHVVISAAGNVTTIYLNGKLDSSASQTPTPALQTTFLLGGNYWGPLEGWSDDYAIWDRSLTASEVQQLYTQGRGGWLRQPRRRTYGFIPPTFRTAWIQRAKLIGGGV